VATRPSLRVPHHDFFFAFCESMSGCQFLLVGCFCLPGSPGAHCRFLLVGCFCYRLFYRLLGGIFGIFYHQTCWISLSQCPGVFLYFSFAIWCQGRASVCHPDALQAGSFLSPCFFKNFARLPPMFFLFIFLIFFFFSTGGCQCLPPVYLL